MRDPGDELRASDPVGREPDLDVQQTRTIRWAVLHSLDRRDARAESWPRLLMLAATLAMTVGATVLVRSHLPWHHDAAAARPRAVPQADTAASAGDRLQLQFSTRGGTRIIWVFDPQFHP